MVGGEIIKLGYLHSSDYGNSPKVLDALNQANAMEKEQIMDAYEQGESDAYKQIIINIDKKYESFEQYYKETYD